MARTTSKATGDTVDPAEAPDVHAVDEAPDGRHERSAASPGIRTEEEVVADAKADLDATGVVRTADPATEADRTRRVPDTDGGDPDEVVEFTRTDGATFRANEGDAAFRKMTRDPDFTRA